MFIEYLQRGGGRRVAELPFYVTRSPSVHHVTKNFLNIFLFFVTYMMPCKLGVVLDIEILPKGSGSCLWQGVDVPIKQQGVGLGVWSDN